jgi:hypothetical protein
MQQYDTRGHPVNPESRALGKELRRAKNDILSTMGIVVSGEDRNSSIPNEQQKINQIASENDFGLVITTLDQLFIFFGTWWTSSVTGRVQVNAIPTTPDVDWADIRDFMFRLTVIMPIPHYLTSYSLRETLQEFLDFTSRVFLPGQCPVG